MKRHRGRKCTISYCRERVEAGGLCEKHLAAKHQKEIRRDEAIRVLHSGVLEGESFQNSELRKEFTKLQEWWFRACDAVNFRREDPILKDEAQYAIAWCGSLAELIIDDEKADRKCAPRPAWNCLREQLWGRFTNLEAGLRSNGLAKT